MIYSDEYPKETLVETKKKEQSPRNESSQNEEGRDARKEKRNELSEQSVVIKPKNLPIVNSLDVPPVSNRKKDVRPNSRISREIQKQDTSDAIGQTTDQSQTGRSPAFIR